MRTAYTLVRRLQNCHLYLQMTQPQLHSLTKNPSRWGASVGYLIALGLLLLSATSLWLENQGLPTNRDVFYWSLGINLLSWIKCLTLPLALMFIFVWGKRNVGELKKWQFLMAISLFILLLVTCTFTHYVFAWAGSTTNNVGTVNYKGNTYHLARIVHFDESDRYYLGVCTFMGSRCKFHLIFRLNSLYPSSRISLQATQETLLVKVGAELVYSYDGLQEFCADRELEKEVVICYVP
jgi:hypothetical protein